MKSPSGQWISAKPIPGTILVNIGDLLEMWTGGLFPATRHRLDFSCFIMRFCGVMHLGINNLNFILFLRSCVVLVVFGVFLSIVGCMFLVCSCYLHSFLFFLLLFSCVLAGFSLTTMLTG